MSLINSSLTMPEVPEPSPCRSSVVVRQASLPMSNATPRRGLPAPTFASIALVAMASPPVGHAPKWEPVSIICAWPDRNAPSVDSERVRKRKAAFERFSQLRREAEAAGMKLLTTEEILAEVRERRGGMEAAD